MDEVFKALSNPARREILDLLFLEDGRRLVDLCEAMGVPRRMTRIGLRKHVRILASAGLLTPKRSGRETRHYLNPVPIQEIHGRWISKYAAPFVRAMREIRVNAEARGASKIRMEEAER